MEIANCATLFLFQIMRNTIHVFQKAVDALLSVYGSYEVQMLSGVTTRVEYIHFVPLHMLEGNQNNSWHVGTGVEMMAL